MTDKDTGRTDPYASLNDAWKSAGVGWLHHRLTEAQARRMVRTLWRLGGRLLKRPNVRPVWLRQGVRRLVHDLSHRVHAYRTQGRPHAWNHAAWERHFTTEAIKRRWHEVAAPVKGKKSKPKPDRAVRVAQRLKAWRTKAKRAATAIKKLEGQERRLQREERNRPAQLETRI